MPQPRLTSVATAIALETAVPVDFLLAAASLQNLWPNGQTRFTVDGEGPDSLITVRSFGFGEEETSAPDLHPTELLPST
eukprot:14299005-Alexandrium_andersonii.AAC.1